VIPKNTELTICQLEQALGKENVGLTAIALGLDFGQFPTEEQLIAHYRQNAAPTALSCASCQHCRHLEEVGLVGPADEVSMGEILLKHMRVLEP